MTANAQKVNKTLLTCNHAYFLRPFQARIYTSIIWQKSKEQNDGLADPAEQTGKAKLPLCWLRGHGWHFSRSALDSLLLLVSLEVLVQFPHKNNPFIAAGKRAVISCCLIAWFRKCFIQYQRWLSNVATKDLDQIIGALSLVDDIATTMENT